MQEVAKGTRCKNFLYHASINPKEGENLSPGQWKIAVDKLEKNLGLEDHQRAIVEHVKDGRVHHHIVWNRANIERMCAVKMSHNYRAHETTSREIEREFGLDRVQGALVERDGERPERQPKQWEVDRGRRTGVDPRQVKAEVSSLWLETESGQDFKAALESHGYLLAQGDRRDFVIIDKNGDPHSITRRTGAKAAEIRFKMADVEREALPTVDEARERQLEQKEKRRNAKEAAKAAKMYDRADMASQQQDALKHHTRRLKALKNRQREARKAEEQRTQEQAEKQSSPEGKPTRTDERSKGSFARRQDQATAKREERAARTEQTDAKQRKAGKDKMQEMFERKFNKTPRNHERERDEWERER